MKFGETFFGITPTSFYSVDIDFTRGKDFLVINFNMSISTKHQRIVPSKFVSIDDVSSSNRFNGHIQQGLIRYIRYHFHFDNPIAFQHTRYWHFVRHSTSPFPFSLVTEMPLIHFHFTIQQGISVAGARDDSHSNDRDCFQHDRIVQADLLSDSPSRVFPLEEFEDSQLILTVNLNLIESISC